MSTNSLKDDSYDAENYGISFSSQTELQSTNIINYVSIIDPPADLPIRTRTFPKPRKRSFKRTSSVTPQLDPIELDFDQIYASLVNDLKFSSQQIVYISSTGSDINGTGTKTRPYQTAHKAYSTITANTGFSTIIALEGVYDLESILAKPGGTLAYTTDKVLFFGDETTREKTVNIISEKLHKCKIKGSVNLVLDETYGINGFSLGVARYKFNSQHLPYSKALEKIDFKIFDYDYNNTEVKQFRQNTLVPCMLNKGLTGSSFPELYLSYPSAFTLRAAPNQTLINETNFIEYGRTTTYEASVPVGITLYGITGAAASSIMNLINSRNASGVTTIWTDTTLIFYGGNNNTSYNKVVGISYADQNKINIMGKPGFKSIESIAFIGNKSWLGNTYEYAYEIVNDEKYFYIKTDNTVNPRVAILDYGINLCKTKNINFIGFDILEFRQQNIGYSSNDPNFTKSSNIGFKYNKTHDSDNSVFTFKAHSSNIIGNLAYRSVNRGMFFSGCTSNNINYNTIVGWNNLTGLGFFECSDIKVHGNAIHSLVAAHGNGMVCYLGCKNFTFTKNFVYTPNLIGLALQEYDGITGGTGFIIDNNVLFSAKGLKIYPINQTENYRGDLAKFKVTNNTAGFEYTSHNLGDGPWWVFNNYIHRNNFDIGTSFVYPSKMSPIGYGINASDAIGSAVAHLTPDGNFKTSPTTGLSGYFIAGASAIIGPAANSVYISVPASYSNQLNENGLFYMIYAGVCGSSNWTHRWFPGITKNGQLIADAKAFNRVISYHKNYDGVTALLNNIFIRRSLQTNISASTSALGTTQAFDFTDTNTKSRLLLNQNSSSSIDIFQPGYYFADSSGSTLENYLRDPVGRFTGKYDFRGKTTINDYLGNTINVLTDQIGVQWIGPASKGITYNTILNGNYYDWWLYNEGL